MVLPSGPKRITFTRASRGGAVTPTGAGLARSAMSQNWTVPSRTPAARVRPSGRAATASTAADAGSVARYGLLSRLSVRLARVSGLGSRESAARPNCRARRGSRSRTASAWATRPRVSDVRWAATAASPRCTARYAATRAPTSSRANVRTPPRANLMVRRCSRMCSPTTRSFGTSRTAAATSATHSRNRGFDWSTCARSRSHRRSTHLGSSGKAPRSADGRAAAGSSA